MKLFKYTFLLLLLIINISCDRNAGGIAHEQSGTTENSGTTPDAAESDSNIHNFGVVAAENRFQETEDPGWNWWKLGAIFSLALNITLFLLLRHTILAKEYYRKRKKYYKDAFLNPRSPPVPAGVKKGHIPEKQPKIRNGYIPKGHPREENRTVRKSVDNSEKSDKPPLSAQNATPDALVQQMKKPLDLYAQKATEAHVFTYVSDQRDEHKTIFKLILEDENANTAKFEVLQSEFILRMAANSPDTYLYTVCNPENSNQNFVGQIITTKKGIAHRVDGEWKVKNENKATIKFQ